VTYVFRELEGSPTSILPAGERLYPGSIATAGLTLVTRDPARTGVDVWVGEETTPAVTLTNPDHGADLTSAALSANGMIVAASDTSGRTYLWNANTATRTDVLKAPDGAAVSCSVFSFFGGDLVTGDHDGRVYLWNTATGTLLHTMRDANGIVDAVAIGDVGHLIATAGAGNAIYLWNAATGMSLGKISDPGGSRVTSLAFNLMGTQLAVADENGTN
jgi:WD40 repeat protein